ncbi:MAG: Nif3-like dinuclear metal center hexameric protein [Bacillota bacterium]
MSYKIKDALKVIENFAPLDTQADFDNCGLKYGNMEADLKGILITLDTNEQVVEDAIEKGCNLIVEHHPCIFEPLKRIDCQKPQQKALIKAIKNDIAIYSAHTNIDFAKGGLNDFVARQLGLENIHCLDNEMSSARIGYTNAPIKLKDYKEKVKKVFDDNNIATIGDENKLIKKVSIINGSGGSDGELLLRLKENGVDIFITSDIKYAFARFAKDLNYGIITIGHYNSELYFLSLMENILKKSLKGQKIVKTNKCSNPYNN